ncbi:MAG: precorrin-3B synthase [Pseudomonadota bacterium]
MTERAASTGPEAKGWCPGALRPMMSGDGLIVRVRPRLARLGLAQIAGLCDVAGRFGSGLVDVTNRANLQIRGVTPENHPALMAGLYALGLLDPDADTEARRNILITPYWSDGDLSQRLARDLMTALRQLPTLPAKFGFAIDAGPAPVLTKSPADIRIEYGEDGILILRADGCAKGQIISPQDAISALMDMADWFAQTAPDDVTRMKQIADRVPSAWQRHTTANPAADPRPGETDAGPMLGLPFGQISADALIDLMDRSNATAVRVTPWRMVILEGGQPVQSPNTITDASDPLIGVDACPGAPFCGSATVETRALARALAPDHDQSLHVSGCAKGCARSRPAHTTLVGRDGRFDLVRDGHAWDEPDHRGLAADRLAQRSE